MSCPKPSVRSQKALSCARLGRSAVMIRNIPTRILALDLHPRSFGYVVVEGLNTLLDWGVSGYRGKHGAADVLVRKRLRHLLDLWRPAALVLHNPLEKSRRLNRKKD